MPASFGDQSAADVAAAVATHSADTTSVHGIADTSKLATFDAANPADTVISAVTGAPVSVGGGGSAATTTFTPAGNLAATDVQAALVELDGEKQAADADLTAIAGLSPSNDDLVQRKAGAWTNRTPAQVKTDLALVKGDVGLANVDNTSDANKPVSTAQQTALDAKLALASYAPGLRMKVGKYFGNGTPQNSGGGATKLDGDIRGGRVIISRACTLDAIACEVTTVGTTGALVRLGIYSDDDGLGGSLVLDAGTVSAETLGVKVVAINQALAVGAYWLVAALQGNPGTKPNLRTVAAQNADGGFTATDFRFPPNGGAGVTGALPASLTMASAADIVYFVGIKASA